MVEGFGFVGFVAYVGKNVPPGNGVGGTDDPWARDVSECFSDVWQLGQYQETEKNGCLFEIGGGPEVYARYREVARAIVRRRLAYAR